MILTPLQKLPKNGGDWGKLIVAKGFKRLPKVQKIATSGHTDGERGILPKVFMTNLQVFLSTNQGFVKRCFGKTNIRYIQRTVFSG